MIRFVFPLLALIWLCLGCSPEQKIQVVDLNMSLALELESNDLLEVYVFDNEANTCSQLLNSSDPDGSERIEKQTESAEGLNEGVIDFELEELPAEVPLAFYAHVLRTTEGFLGRDCEDAITIPAGGEIALTLTIESN
jgi:hypothetical protein